MLDTSAEKLKEKWNLLKFHPEPALLIQGTAMNTDDSTDDYHSEYQFCGFSPISDIVREIYCFTSLNWHFSFI